MNMIEAKDGIHSIEKIAHNTYRIDEEGIVNCYLLIGKKSALLIDCGIGYGNIYETVRELTDLPIILAITHRHCDHDGGRNYFRNYYVHRNDKPFVYKLLSSKLACKALLKGNHAKAKLSKMPFHSKPIYFDDNFSFDLGNRVVNTINTPGHTKGSVVFLDASTNLMFTGDDVNPFLWMQLPGSTSLSTWLIGAKIIFSLTDNYTAYCGHVNGYETKEEIAGIINLVFSMLQNKPKFKGNSVIYPPDEKAKNHIFVSRNYLKQN